MKCKLISSTSFLLFALFFIPQAHAQSWDGTWAITETFNASACDEPDYTESYTVEVSQSGNVLIVSVEGQSLPANGPASGNSFSIESSTEEEGGVWDSKANFTFSGNEVSGGSSWTWTDDFSSCSGTSSFTGYRINTTISDVSNPSGTWEVNEEVNATACEEGIYTDNFLATAVLTGNQLSVTANGIKRSGTLNGNSFNYSVSIPEDGGTTTTTGNLTFNGNQVSGSSNWSWTDGNVSCDGTSAISGTRIGVPATESVTNPGGGVSPPSAPIPAAVKVTSLGGSRNAEISLGAYASTGEPAYGNDFTTDDFVTIIGEIVPDTVDVGVNGKLFAAMLSVIAGKASFSFLDEDGNFQAWDTTLPGLGAAAAATPLEESHQLTVFEGELQAGVHKITFAYQAQGGPLVYMKPITLRVTD